MSFTHRELQKCAEREITMIAAIAEHFRELADADDGESVALPLYERKE